MAQTRSAEEFLHKANSLLVNCEFIACLEICEKGLEECTAESDEQDVWSLLLFLKVGDSDRADILATSWLENKENLSNITEYKSVLEMYVRRVLFAKNMVEKAEYFLQNSDILTDKEKQALMRCANSEQSRIRPEKETTSEPRTVENHSSNQNTSRCTLVLQRISCLLYRLITRVRQWSQNPHTYYYIQQVLRILALTMFIYSLLFMNSSTAVISPGSGISQLWNATVQAWKSLFFPYHLAPLQ